MQSAAPEAVDLSRESAETRALYGLDDRATAEFGTRCLLARRLVERGVRFVQLYSGDVNGWDAHDDVERNHAAMCARTDRPIAALLRDLKRRGLLDETLVIWGGEFGRMPMSEGGKGRDHNPHGFSVWLAGGGVKGGVVHGATDAIGLRAEVDRVHVHDLHATILHLLGLDHTLLTFLHNGREERLTDTAGKVVKTEKAVQSGNDGLVVMRDGTKYVSSVVNGGVSRIRPGRPAELVARNIPNPASMCYDPDANQLVIPMNANNALAFIKLR